MFLPWSQCITVVWNRTARGTSKTRKIHSVQGRARYTDRYTDVYEIITCMHCMLHVRTHTQSFVGKPDFHFAIKR